MANIFSHIQVKAPRKNTFNLSHERKQTMKMGVLTPSFVMECVPGDHVKMDSSQMVRMAPLVSPVMHNINVYTHYFFVPNRIMWDNWEDYITGGEDGLSNASIPTAGYGGTGNPGNLYDYLGYPFRGNGGSGQEQLQVFRTLP